MDANSSFGKPPLDVNGDSAKLELKDTMTFSSFMFDILWSQCLLFEPGNHTPRNGILQADWQSSAKNDNHFDIMMCFINI